MATRHSTTPARAGERLRSPSALYARQSPLLARFIHQGLAGDVF